MFQQLFLPPGAPLVVLGLAWLLWTRRPKLARAAFAIGGASLYLVSTPIVSALAMGALVADEPAVDVTTLDVQAIVVLGADVVLDAPEYGGDSLGPLSLERLRYAARLQHATDLPLLVSGGRVLDSTPIAAVMAEALAREFSGSARWIESSSRNTRENASLSAALLRKDGVERIALVTHAWHMPRARWCFEQEGLTVVPAGTGFFAAPPRWPGALMPTSRALRHTSLALHEMLGRLWYRLRE